MNPRPLETARLMLMPLTQEMILALLRSRGEFKEMCVASVPDSWPGPDLLEALPSIAEGTQDAGGVWTRVVVLRKSNSIIGDIGFIIPPGESGAVELGYSIVPEERGRGYATEAVEAICAWALGQPSVTSITAVTLPDNRASHRVLQKTGFSIVVESKEMLHWQRKG